MLTKCVVFSRVYWKVVLCPKNVFMHSIKVLLVLLKLYILNLAAENKIQSLNCNKNKNCASMILIHIVQYFIALFNANREKNFLWIFHPSSFNLISIFLIFSIFRFTCPKDLTSRKFSHFIWSIILHPPKQLEIRIFVSFKSVILRH